MGPIENLQATIKKAGSAVMLLFGSSRNQVKTKSDKSPVSDADRIAHDILCQGIKTHSQAPIVSEEGSVEARAAIDGDQPYWLIDPIDGTKSFLSGKTSFAINIAYMERHRPVMGLVYAPARDVCYWASEGKGAYRQAGEAAPQRIHTRPMHRENFHLLLSRHHNKADPNRFVERWPNCTIEAMGSALKMCLIAEGAADLHIRMLPTSEWDTAAPHIILNEAGGLIQTLDLSEFCYGKKDLLNPGFVVCGDPSVDLADYLAYV